MDTSNFGFDPTQFTNAPLQTEGWFVFHTSIATAGVAALGPGITVPDALIDAAEQYGFSVNVGAVPSAEAVTTVAGVSPWTPPAESTSHTPTHAR